MYEWGEDIYGSDCLTGMCKICEVNYADNPHLLCEECAEDAYNNTYALEEWLENDGFDDFLEWYFNLTEYRGLPLVYLRNVFQKEDAEAKNEGYKEYAKNHFKNYEEWYVRNKNWV